MRKLSTSELNRLSITDYKTFEKIPVVIVLDNIRSMHNTGSIFRTADAFCIEEIHLCGLTATPPHREIQKTALGATESVNWKYFAEPVDSIRILASEGYTIIAVEQAENSILLQNFSIDNISRIALVFGNEINGVSDGVMEIIDKCIEIPQFGTKHSFNVSISAGIVLWHISCLFHNKI
ncbi:MAG: RNA methyltransferase [Lentimicrobiaceae bacterium]|nr:RNA methyltransferase [Lentimicrobiaceae bacterium]